MSVLVECSRCGLYTTVVYAWGGVSCLCLGCWLKRVGDDAQHNRLSHSIGYTIGKFAEDLVRETENAEAAT